MSIQKYHPRPVAAAGGLTVFARCYARGEEAVPLRDDQLTDLGVSYWLSLENLLTGAATEEAWSGVVCALNIGMALCETGIGNDYAAEIRAALDGTFRAKVRSAKSGTFRLDGPAIVSITRTLEVHDQQMQLATRAEVVQAMNTVEKRMEDGNVYKLAAA